MDCRQITQTTIALEIVQSPGDSRLQQLFNCIYRLFQESFLSWVNKRFAASTLRQTLREDAKDAFQNGLMAFYNKAKGKNLSIHGSLKTTLFSFGLLQLLACFKKEKKHRPLYLHGLDLFFEDAFLESEKQQLLSEKESELMKALGELPRRPRDILIMKFFEHLHSKEIACRLHVSAGHVDNEAARAFRLLRHMLSAKPVSKK